MFCYLIKARIICLGRRLIFLIILFCTSVNHNSYANNTMQTLVVYFLTRYYDLILPRYIKRSKRSDGAQLKFRNVAKFCAARKIEAGEYRDRKAGIAFARIQRANIPMQFA